jgi:hypothetical protein
VTDLLARILQGELSCGLGHPVVVEKLAVGRLIQLRPEGVAVTRDRPDAILAALHHQERPPRPAVRALIARLQAG